VFAQDDGGTSSTGLPIDLGVFGVASTTIAILLVIIRQLYKDNKELAVRVVDIQTTAIEKVSRITVEANHQLGESAKVLEATSVMMHSLAGRQGVSSEQLIELTILLRELRDIRRTGG
jgi:hypothetical protein